MPPPDTAPPQPPEDPATMARLLDQYNATIAPELTAKFGIKNKMAIPSSRRS